MADALSQTCVRPPPRRPLAAALVLAACAAWPRPSAGRSAMEALARGQTYPIAAVPYCTAPDALGRLVALRTAGDLDSLPSGCAAPGLTAFAQQFKGFIPDHKVTGVAVQEKLVHPNRFGRMPCPGPGNGAALRCDVRIISAGFVAGVLVGTDERRTPAYIEVGYGIEVMDAASGALVFAPLARTQ